MSIVVLLVLGCASEKMKAMEGLGECERVSCGEGSGRSGVDGDIFRDSGADRRDEL